MLEVEERERQLLVEHDESVGVRDDFRLQLAFHVRRVVARAAAAQRLFVADARRQSARVDEIDELREETRLGQREERVHEPPARLRQVDLDARVRRALFVEAQEPRAVCRSLHEPEPVRLHDVPELLVHDEADREGLQGKLQVAHRPALRQDPCARVPVRAAFPLRGAIVDERVVHVEAHDGDGFHVQGAVRKNAAPRRGKRPGEGQSVRGVGVGVGHERGAQPNTKVADVPRRATGKGMTPALTAIDDTDVPAAVFCIQCGRADCVGCVPTDTTLRTGAAPWEQPTLPVWKRLWHTARLSTLEGETFFGNLARRELSRPRLIGFCAHVRAPRHRQSGARVAPDRVRVCTGVRDVIVRGRSPSSARRARHGGGGAGARRLDGRAARPVGVRARARAPHRGRRAPSGTLSQVNALYSCGWDLVTSPVGFAAGCVSTGVRGATAETARGRPDPALRDGRVHQRCAKARRKPGSRGTPRRGDSDEQRRARAALRRSASVSSTLPT